MTIQDSVVSKLAIPPEKASYSYNLNSGIVSVTLQGGKSKSRLDYVGNTSMVSCEWNLDDEEFNYFMTFYHTVAGKGAREFTMDLILNNTALQNHVCKFVPDTLVLNSPSTKAFNVTAELEVAPIPNEQFDIDNLIDISYRNSGLLFTTAEKKIYTIEKGYDTQTYLFRDTFEGETFNPDWTSGTTTTDIVSGEAVFNGEAAPSGLLYKTISAGNDFRICCILDFSELTGNLVYPFGISTEREYTEEIPTREFLLARQDDVNGGKMIVYSNNYYNRGTVNSLGGTTLIELEASSDMPVSENAKFEFAFNAEQKRSTVWYNDILLIDRKLGVVAENITQITIGNLGSNADIGTLRCKEVTVIGDSSVSFGGVYPD